MKNVLVVLVLLAASLGVYVLATGGGKEQAPPPQGSNRNLQARGDQRPHLPEGFQQQPSGAPGAVAILSESVAKRAMEQRVFPWKDTVTEETLIRFEDAWSVDFSDVDFDADVLLSVNGEAITQADFRRRMVMVHGDQAIRARLIHLMGKRVSAQTGQEFGLTDAQWDKYLEVYAEGRGLDVDQAVLFISQTTKLPAEGALRVRRETLEGILALYPPAELVEQIPEEIRSTTDDPNVLSQVLQLSGMMADLRRKLAEVEAGVRPEGPESSQFFGSLDILVILAQDAFESEIVRRSWNFVDAELPADALVGYATGPIPSDGEGGVQLLPPWALPGEPIFVSTDEMYAVLGGDVQRHVKEDVLAELVWSKALEQRLAREGALPTPEEVWLEYAGDFVKSKQAAVLSSRFLMGLEGFGSDAHYRESRTFRLGFKATQPEGWGDEESLREFFEKHRFFIQKWQPDLSVALFPPFDPASDAVGEVDWSQAEEAATGFHEAVSADPSSFDKALQTHNSDLVERYRAGRGDAVAQAFQSEFELGRLNRSVPQVNEVLREMPAQQDVRTTSVVRNAVVRLEKGEIGPPWRTPIGYVVVRLNNARLSGLEEEYEDLELGTRLEFERTAFRIWVNETLKSAQVSP